MIVKFLKSKFRKNFMKLTHLKLSLLTISMASFLTACGGGSNSSSSDSIGSSTTNSSASSSPTPTMLATLVSHGTDFTWERPENLKVSLVDQNNQPIAIQSCISDDTVRLTITNDCSSLTAHRLGQSTFTVLSAKNQTARITINTVPDKYLFPVNSIDQSIQRLVLEDGKVSEWGYILLSKNLLYPTVVQGLENIYQTSTTPFGGYALNKFGELYGWGSYLNGVTISGNSTVTNPEPLKDISGMSTASLKNVVKIAADDIEGGAAVLDDGRVIQWNPDNSTFTSYSIIKNQNGQPLTNIRDVAMYNFDSYAIDNNGQVYHWIAGERQVASPAELVKDSTGTPITGVTKISIHQSTLALTKNGEVYIWGDVTSGRAGEQTLSTNSIDYAVPIMKNGARLSGIKDIAQTETNLFALTNNGNVYAWGDNIYGLLGNGDLTFHTVGERLYARTPSLVVDENRTGILSNVAAISTAENAVFAIKNDGSLVGWGDNNNYWKVLTQDGKSFYPYPVAIKSSSTSNVKIDLSKYTKLN